MPTDPISAARQIITDLGASATFDGAVLSGSIAAGLQHAYSDVDVHVLMRPGATLDRLSHVTDGIEVQITPVASDTLAGLRDLFGEFVATRANRAQSTLDDERRWQYLRLLSSRPLLEGTLVDEIERVDRTVARQVVMANFAHRVARQCEDAAGMLANDDAPGASSPAISALNSAFEVALAASDDLYALDRFLVRRIRRSAAVGPWLATYWRLTRSLPSIEERDELSAAVAEIVGTAAFVSGWPQLAAWDEPLAELPVRRPGPQRSLGFGILRFRDGVSLTGPTTAVRLNPMAAACWLAADGQSPSAAWSQLADAGFEFPDVESISACLRRLHDIGALTSPALTGASGA